MLTLLVDSFIFTLQEFARELVSLIDAMGRIYIAERVAASEPWWIVRVPKMMYRSLKKRFRKDRPSTVLPRTRGRTNNETNSGLRRRICAYFRLINIDIVRHTVPLFMSFERSDLTVYRHHSHIYKQTYLNTHSHQLLIPKDQTPRPQHNTNSRPIRTIPLGTYEAVPMGPWR